MLEILALLKVLEDILVFFSLGGFLFKYDFFTCTSSNNFGGALLFFELLFVFFSYKFLYTTRTWFKAAVLSGAADGFFAAFLAATFAYICPFDHFMRVR